ALANMDAAVTQRINRFTSAFFTGMPTAEYEVGEAGRFGLFAGNGLHAATIMQEIQGLAVPVAAEGNALVQTVEDLQSQTRLKVGRARLAVDDTLELLAEDLLTGCYWLDMRKEQRGGRSFGPVVTNVWQTFRTEARSVQGPGQEIRPAHDLA